MSTARRFAQSGKKTNLAHRRDEVPVLWVKPLTYRQRMKRAQNKALQRTAKARKEARA